MLAALEEGRGRLGDAERAVADYCRERRKQGATAEAVLLEVRRLSQGVLGFYSRHVERIVNTCIQHFYPQEPERA